ncbi:MAG: ATP-binding cassette domain-containing protein [Nitrospira sp.]|nr:ATP-binding cassette domain-containing protein [Nitrospira sp.]
MPVLELSGAAVEMEGQGQWSDLTLSLDEGAACALIGPNRGGKTLALKLCAGLVTPEQGAARLFGQDLNELNEEGLAELRQRVGTVLQAPGLLSNMTVFNNVALPLRYHRGLSDEELEPLVMVRLEALGVAGLRHRFPAELNQGEARCVAIARALSLDQELLLLDDPLEGLDALTSRRLGEWLQAQRQSRPLTILATTRRASSLLAMVDRFAFVRDGRVQAQGRYEELLASADDGMKDYLQ